VAEIAKLVGGPADGMHIAVQKLPHILVHDGGTSRVVEYLRIPTVGGQDDGACETWICTEPGYGVLAVEGLPEAASWAWLRMLICRAYQEDPDVVLEMSLRTVLRIIGDLMAAGEPDEATTWMWSRDPILAGPARWARRGAPIGHVDPGHASRALSAVVGVDISVADVPDGVVMAKMARRG